MPQKPRRTLQLQKTPLVTAGSVGRCLGGKSLSCLPGVGNTAMDGLHSWGFLSDVWFVSMNS